MHSEKRTRKTSTDDKFPLDTSVSVSTLAFDHAKKKRIALHTKRPDLAKIVCQSLGIEYSELTLKTKEEMYDPKKLKEANELIYDHYLKRYYRRLAQVESKVREMMYLGKADMKMISEKHNMRSHSSSESHDIILRHDTKPSHRQETYQDYVCHTQSARQKSLQRDADYDSGHSNLEEQEIATNVVYSYKKKLEKVQEQWEEQTKNLRNKPIGDPNRLLNHALQSQIERLNRNIDKAEKYAQSIIDLNNKRMEIKEEISQRDKKVKRIKRKLVAERNASIQKNRENFEERMKEIKAQRREYNIKLRKKAKKMEERFDELEKKMTKEEEERKESVKTKELEFMVKVSKAKEIKDAEYDEIVEEHRYEENRCNRQVENMLGERKKRCEESAKSFRESYDKAKEKREALMTERDSRTIQKIFKKFEGTDHIKEIFQASMKKKYEESLEKQQQHRKNYLEVIKNKSKWVKDVVETYRKSQDRVKEFQEEKMKNLVLKKEVHNLKRLDQAENYSGIMKLREMRNCQIIDKERADSLKMNMFREQSLILSQARIDVDRRVKQKVGGMIDSAYKEGNRSVDPPVKKSQRSSSAAQLCLSGSQDLQMKVLR